MSKAELTPLAEAMLEVMYIIEAAGKVSLTESQIANALQAYQEMLSRHGVEL